MVLSYDEWINGHRWLAIELARHTPPHNLVTTGVCSPSDPKTRIKPPKGFHSLRGQGSQPPSRSAAAFHVLQRLLASASYAMRQTLLSNSCYGIFAPSQDPGWQPQDGA